jgi:hypothetical protein
MADMATGEASPMPTSAAGLVLYGVEYLLLWLAGVSIAVAWHRLMILNEQPGFSGGNVATKNLWRYVAVGITLFLILLLPMAAITPPKFFFQQPGSGPPSEEVSGLRLLGIAACVVAVFVVGIPAMLRLSLLLPAQAIGNTGLTWSQTWSRTRGNAWRLIWGSLITTVPPGLLQIVFLFLIRPELPSEAFAADVIATVTDLLFLPIWIGFLSHAYRHFFQAPLQLPE